MKMIFGMRKNEIHIGKLNLHSNNNLVNTEVPGCSKLVSNADISLKR